METGGGDGSEMGSVTVEGKQKSTTGVNASLTADFRDRGEQHQHTGESNPADLRPHYHSRPCRRRRHRCTHSSGAHWDHTATGWRQ